MNTLNERTITPEEAIALLKKSNVIVDLEEATVIVRFLTLLAEIHLNEGDGQ